MININLLPEDQRRKRIDYAEIFGKYKNSILPGAGVLAGIILAAAMVVVIYPKLQGISVRRLDARWKNIEKDYKEVDAIKKEQKKIQQSLDGINKILKDRIIWARVLNNISDSLPNEIQLTELSTQIEKIKDKPDRSLLVVSGVVPVSPGERAISDFIKGLRESPEFTKNFPAVEPPSTETTLNGYKKFTLKCYMTVPVKEAEPPAPKKKKDETKSE